jgi:cysteine synthase
VLEILARWRPTPLRRAYALERHLGTPAKIFYKDESVSPPGSHKPNTAVAQAWYNKQAGIKRLTTETGAGQWGCALAFAGQLLGIQVDVWMVRVSFEQKPFRKIMMETWGARCVPSPSTETQAGRTILEQDPDTPGSLGIAISEAIEAAVTDPSGTTRYSLGSVLNHVMLHQTIIGLEAKKQLKLAGVDRPDVVIGCAGGGSNFAGLSFPFVADKIHGADIEIIRGRGVPDPDPRAVRLRPRRHRPHDAAAPDALARTRVHPAVDPRRRPALPRDRPAGQRRRAARTARPARRGTARVLRGGRAVRADRGPHPGAGNEPRHRRHDCRGAQGEGGGP